MRVAFVFILVLAFTSCVNMKRSADFRQVKKTMDSIYILPPLFNIKTLTTNNFSYVDSFSNLKLYDAVAKNTANFLSQKYTVLRYKKYRNYPKDSAITKQMSQLFGYSLLNDVSHFRSYKLNDTIIGYLDNFPSNYFLVYYISGFKKTGQLKKDDGLTEMATVFVATAIFFVTGYSPLFYYLVPIEHAMQVDMLLIDKKKKRLIYFDRYNENSVDPYDQLKYNKAIEILNDYID